METDSPVEAKLIELLHRAVADAEQRGYERGIKETMAKIQRLVLGGDEAATLSDLQVEQHAPEHDNAEGHNTADDDGNDRKRAPKGLVRKVIVRALSDRTGLSVQGIQATAQGDLEKMIQPSSYRSELRKGRDSGLYHEDSGRWYLVANEKTEERPESTPSVFGQAAAGR